MEHGQLLRWMDPAMPFINFGFTGLFSRLLQAYIGDYKALEKILLRSSLLRALNTKPYIRISNVSSSRTNRRKQAFKKKRKPYRP